jgi:hypothetical protein
MAQFTEVQQYPKSVLGETCRLFPGSRRSSLHRTARSRGSSLSRSTYKVPWLQSAVLHIGHGCNGARYMAATRIEVLRFDHRGVGESTAFF